MPLDSRSDYLVGPDLLVGNELRERLSGRVPPTDAKRMPGRVRVHLVALGGIEIRSWLEQPGTEGDCLGLYRVFRRRQNGPVRVVVTHIGQDGTMLRRVVDTARCTDGPQWEGLATRALHLPPPYHPVPGAPVYHVSVDNRMVALAAEHDLCGPLLDLVIAVLAMGDEVLAPLPGSFANRFAKPSWHLGIAGMVCRAMPQAMRVTTEVELASTAPMVARQLVKGVATAIRDLSYDRFFYQFWPGLS